MWLTECGRETDMCKTEGDNPWGLCLGTVEGKHCLIELHDVCLGKGKHCVLVYTWGGECLSTLVGK